MIHQPKVLKEFCQAFGLYLEEGHRTFYKRSPSYPRLDDYDMTVQAETMGSLCIHIPEDKISRVCSMLEEINLLNEYYRENNPAVKTAYEKYLMLLALVKENHD